MRKYAKSEKGGRFRVSGSMPAAGARKSTKGFVPKSSAVAQVPEDEPVAVVLRSGKRLVLSKPSGKKVEAGGCEDEWIRLFGRAVEEAGPRWWAGEDGMSGRSGGRKPAVFCNGGSAKRVDVLRRSGPEKGEMGTMCVKRYGRSYNRKRRRLPEEDAATLSSGFRDEDDDSFRYGVVYVRRRNMANTLSLEEDVLKSKPLEEGSAEECEGADEGFGIAEPTRIFAEKFGIFGGEIWSGQLPDQVALVVLVDSVPYSIHHFSQFIIVVLFWMRRKSVNLLNFMCFLLCKAMQSAFSQHGVHFLPIHLDNYDGFRNAKLHTGVCSISGSLELIPLLSVNFSALPLFFKMLHMDMLLLSRFMPVHPVSGPLLEFCSGVLWNAVEDVLLGSAVTDVNKNTVMPSGSSLAESFSLHLTDSGPVKGAIVSRSSFASAAEISNCSSKQHNKIAIDVNGNVRATRDLRLASRSFANCKSRITRSQKRRTSLRSVRKRTSMANSNKSFSDNILRDKDKPAAKFEFLGQDAVYLDESTEAKDCTISFTSSNEILKKPCQSFTDRMKELKSVVSDIKCKIDSISCKASILVIETDRCWREEGAEVMLESFDSIDWYLSVKVNGSTRYLHKAQESRPSVPNRHTHAMIWSGESNWKLEFFNRIDWIIFKQLHRECYERNISDVSAKCIPVPGVRPASDYENQGTFVRPDAYIKTECTEIERVLISQISYYDMDTGDEEWLAHFNSGRFHSATLLSEDSFEKIIYSFEKSAYNSPEGALSQDVAAGLCLDLADIDTVATVFGYWLKKKKHRRPLVRFFQEYPKQKMHVTQGLFLRKKRSFKRQGSSLGRGKPAFYMQAGAKQEELRKFREAAAAALRAEEIAIKLRRNAQLLMSNADLLTYKSVMALRLAEAMKESESPDVLTTIL